MLEWPDRAGASLPADRLDITFTLAPQLGSQGRNARVTGFGSFAARVDRLAALRRFLARSGYADAERQKLPGDASTRSYERLTLDTHHAMLMNSPRRPDGPPVRDGKPYSAIAHLAEDVVPFVALAQGLRAHGLSAPDIYASDLEHGFLVIEDLGSDGVVAGDPPLPIEERYAEAVDVLLTLHAQDLPDTLPAAEGVTHTIPPYDIGALEIELELLPDWYIPRFGGSLASEARAEYLALWRKALQPVLAAPRTWVLRDYHSPNLLWLPDRAEVQRVGLLDFQDAMMGPAAYDLASLLQDARVDASEELEIALLSRYTRGRQSSDPAFDISSFATLYATLAAQRASKILGIFARLERRDGKPQYLRHIPRIWKYLQRSLAHPGLASLKEWYGLNVPKFHGI
jgi:aminoglycoside/choline kinase family phosphotransferase